MDKNIKIIIPQEVTNDIQRADLEYSSRRNILIYIMQNNIDIPKDRFDQYQKEYDEKFFLFEQLKQKIEKNYVIPNIKGKIMEKWYLDYPSSILYIFIKE